MPSANTFKKRERLCSRKDIDKLFNRGGSRSMAAFPLRLVYKLNTVSADDTFLADDKPRKPEAQLLISVPKRCLKHAVDRNRVKRQVREAFRLNKTIIDGVGCHMAFIWLDDKLWPTETVTHKVQSLLQRLSEKHAAITAAQNAESNEDGVNNDNAESNVSNAESNDSNETAGNGTQQ